MLWLLLRLLINILLTLLTYLWFSEPAFLAVYLLRVFEAKSLVAAVLMTSVQVIVAVVVGAGTAYGTGVIAQGYHIQMEQ